MTENTPIKRRLRGDQAARYITERSGAPCTAGWLNNLRVVGGGPPFIKWGRFPLYDPEDLDRWIISRFGPKQKSTSETVDNDSGIHTGSNPAAPNSSPPGLTAGARTKHLTERRTRRTPDGNGSD